MVNWEPQHAVHQPKNVGWVVGIVTLTRIAGLDSSVEITIVTEILNSMPIQRMIAAMIQNKKFVMVTWEQQLAAFQQKKCTIQLLCVMAALDKTLAATPATSVGLRV